MRTQRIKTGFRRICLAAALCGLLGSSPGAAREDAKSGNFWVKLCSAPDSSLCIGYLSAVIDMHTFTVGVYCPPKTVTVGQMQLVVVKYLGDNPARLHEPFIGLTLYALKDAFPCR